MKIMLRNWTEQLLSNVNRLPLEMAKSRPKEKKMAPGNVFFSWQKVPPKFLEINGFAQKNVSINLSLLEKFVRSAEAEEISCQSFIASYLQHQSMNAQTASAMENALAVRKMMALVRTTVLEMRMIELLFSSRHKG